MTRDLYDTRDTGRNWRANAIKRMESRKGMTIDEIKRAVLSGATVHWSNSGYRVTRDSIGQWLIVCDNGSAIGLTWSDGATLNGKESEFYIADSAP